VSASETNPCRPMSASPTDSRQESTPNIFPCAFCVNWRSLVLRSPISVEHAGAMNTPTNNSPFVHTSRKRVQAQVVTLERVQQSFPATSFTVSQVVHQQRPRFGNDASLNRLDIKEVEVEGMRGVLESCWDLSATTTTTAPPVHQGSSIRHAQMQRLRRTRSEPHGRFYSLGTAPGLQPSLPKSRSSATSSASAQLSPVLQSAAGVTNQQTHQLHVLMDLWHLFVTHESFHTSQDFGG